MIAHVLKAAFCKCGALSTAKEMAFWGECRRCRVSEAVNRKGLGTPNPATPKSEVTYNGSIKGGEW
jgi:hypothetical protein